jgi:NADH-quinone oxidoreductase subunit J
VAAAKADYAKLRDEVVLLAGAGQLPARNVGNLGYLLYTDHLLAVELAGTLLLVATIGAIAIAQRKRETA